MSALDLTPLRDFGQEAEQLGGIQVDVGGFIVPGREPTPTHIPGNGERSHEQRQGEETRSAAGSWPGPQAEAAASGEASHPVRTLIVPGVSAEELEELDDYYPGCRVVTSSSRFVVYGMSVGLFRTLPFRARLYLEVPRVPFDSRTRAFVPWRYPRPAHDAGDFIEARPTVDVPLVPVVRAWAFWEGGVGHGTQIFSHHVYPDGSICACMSHQWIRGIDRTLDYAGMCVSWIGKVLHEREFGFYPGPQHLPAWARVARDRPHEFCGCSSRRRYSECCRPADRRLTKEFLTTSRENTRREYFKQLEWQSRPRGPITA